MFNAFLVHQFSISDFDTASMFKKFRQMGQKREQIFECSKKKKKEDEERCSNWKCMPTHKHMDRSLGKALRGVCIFVFPTTWDAKWFSPSWFGSLMKKKENKAFLTD